MNCMFVGDDESLRFILMSGDAIANVLICMRCFSKLYGEICAVAFSAKRMVSPDKSLNVIFFNRTSSKFVTFKLPIPTGVSNRVPSSFVMAVARYFWTLSSLNDIDATYMTPTIVANIMNMYFRNLIRLFVLIKQCTSRVIFAKIVIFADIIVKFLLETDLVYSNFYFDFAGKCDIFALLKNEIKSLRCDILFKRQNYSPNDRNNCCTTSFGWLFH